MHSFQAIRPPTILAILSFISVAAFFVKVKASILDGSTPFDKAKAILLVKTLVFPDPAPATISTGPSISLTACLCSAFSPSKIAFSMFSIMARKYGKNPEKMSTFAECKLKLLSS